MEVKPGYKQTEVGVIPEDWSAVNMEKITAHIGDGLHGTPIYSPNGEYFFINGNNLSGGKIVATSDTKSVDYSEFVKYRKPLSDRSILLSINGTIGNLALYGGEQVVLGKSAAYLNVRPQVCKHFVYHSLQTNIVKRQFFDGLSGSTIGNLGLATIRQTQIPLPPTDTEQRAIATALSDMDGLLGGLDRLIAKKRDLKQAAMQQLLTGQTRLPGFHGEWEVKTLGDIVEKIVGGGTPSRANTAFWGNEIPWVTVKDFATFNPRQSQESITRLGLRNSASHLIPAGTLITSTRMALGKAVVYEVAVAINQDLKALFLKPKSSVVFLTYWFEHFGSMIDELGSGSTVKGISLGELRRFPFHAPPHPEQTAIAEVLTEMDAELSALEQRRAKTRALKQAMMQELLTGRTRLI
jgi:type I restriction enzyme S subunit